MVWYEVVMSKPARFHVRRLLNSSSSCFAREPPVVLLDVHICAVKYCARWMAAAEDHLERPSDFRIRSHIDATPSPVIWEVVGRFDRQASVPVAVEVEKVRGSVLGCHAPLASVNVHDRLRIESVDHLSRYGWNQISDPSGLCGARSRANRIAR